MLEYSSVYSVHSALDPNTNIRSQPGSFNTATILADLETVVDPNQYDFVLLYSVQEVPGWIHSGTRAIPSVVKNVGLDNALMAYGTSYPHWPHLRSVPHMNSLDLRGNEPLVVLHEIGHYWNVFWANDAAGPDAWVSGDPVAWLATYCAHWTWLFLPQSAAGIMYSAPLGPRFTDFDLYAMGLMDYAEASQSSYQVRDLAQPPNTHTLQLNDLIDALAEQGPSFLEGDGKRIPPSDVSARYFRALLVIVKGAGETITGAQQQLVFDLVRDLPAAWRTATLNRSGLNAQIAPPPDRIGVYGSGQWRQDANGTGAFEPGPDKNFAFGFPGATLVSGDWNGDGKTQAGLFSKGFWFLDYDGNGVWDGGETDKQYEFGWNGVTPVVGDWDGDGRDSVGIFVNGFWFLDVDGDGVWDGPVVDRQAELGWNGVTPLAGDWNGDGRDSIGIFINGFWYLDYDGSGTWGGPGVDRQGQFGWTGVTPLVGDWSGDGRDGIGIFANNFWFLDADKDLKWDGASADIQAEFGFAGASPVIGDWDGDGRQSIGVFSGGSWFLDYDDSADWDGGVADKAFVFGQAGDVPLPGKW